MRHGMAAVQELSIEEWRGASPVYGERLRRIMAVEGDGVPAIFKVLQLDPGFPHHYLDVRYEVVDERHGYFELAYCGALMDVEPWGDRMVTSHVPPHRGRHLRLDGPGRQPQGPDPPRPPAAPACRATARPTAAGRWSSTTRPRPCPRPPITGLTRGTTAATFSFPPMKDGTPHIPEGAGTERARVERRHALGRWRRPAGT